MILTEITEPFSPNDYVYQTNRDSRNHILFLLQVGGDLSKLGDLSKRGDLCMLGDFSTFGGLSKLGDLSAVQSLPGVGGLATELQGTGLLSSASGLLKQVSSNAIPGAQMVADVQHAGAVSITSRILPFAFRRLTT